MPPNSLNILDFCRVAEDFHTIVVEGVGLGQVDDVEPDFHSFGRVAYSVEEPLGVAIGVNVILKNEIVLVVSLFDDSQEVSRLEARLEQESAVFRTLEFIHLLGPVIVRF
jgi:hypothetical protein